jgi:hypothetical protein
MLKQVLTATSDFTTNPVDKVGHKLLLFTMMLGF